MNAHIAILGTIAGLSLAIVPRMSSAAPVEVEIEDDEPASTPTPTPSPSPSPAASPPSTPTPAPVQPERGYGGVEAIAADPSAVEPTPTAAA
ncbi:MAG: hypothetical protein IAG13_04840, partial [Deltaproteobacteria bacterium]|nr:hypothetical protein [Nannocystaceae bacterium]